MPGPLFTAASFPGVTAPRPTPDPGPPGGGSDPVSLTLSDGSTTVVFDQLTTALLCLEFLRLRNQWLLQASDDIWIAQIGGVKLLVGEMTLTNQKLLSSFCPVYVGGQTRFNHRTMSQSLSLDDALQALGFFKPSSQIYRGNTDLTAAPSPHIVVCDFNYRASPATATAGSQLNDATPLNYDFTS